MEFAWLSAGPLTVQEPQLPDLAKRCENFVHTCAKNAFKNLDAFSYTFFSPTPARILARVVVLVVNNFEH